jgi:hypothetical protein
MASDVQVLADFSYAREVAGSSRHGNNLIHLSKIVYQDGSVMYKINLLKNGNYFQFKY